MWIVVIMWTVNTILSVIHRSGTTNLEAEAFAAHYKDTQKCIVSGSYQAFPNYISYMKITNCCIFYTETGFQY